MRACLRKVSRSSDWGRWKERTCPECAALRQEENKDKGPAWGLQGLRCWHQGTPHRRMELSWSRDGLMDRLLAKAKTDGWAIRERDKGDPTPWLPLTMAAREPLTRKRAARGT